MLIPFRIRHCNPTVDGPALRTLHDSLTTMEKTESGPARLKSSFPIEWDGQTPPKAGWVAVPGDDAENIVGFSWLFQATRRRTTLGVVVHPEFRGQGLGRSLLDTILNEAKETETAQVVAYVNVEDALSQTFLESQGFELGWEARELYAPEGSAIPEPEFPEGYFLRRFSDLLHLPTLAALINRALFDTPGNPSNEPNAITDELLEAQLAGYPQLYPTDGLFLLLNSFGKAVGYVRACESGTIFAPRVVPEERQKGLYQPLLLVAMAHLRQQGAPIFRLFSDGEPEARIDSYRSLGFSFNKRFTVMYKNLDSA